LLKIFACRGRNNIQKEGQNYDNNDLSEADAIDYFPNLCRPIEGKSNGKPFSIELTMKAQVHRYLLFNCDEITIYIMYDNSLLSFYSLL